MSALAGCTGTRGTAEAGSSDEVDRRLADADFAGVVDRTGQSVTTIDVGRDGENQFDPPVLQISPGTTVRWVWDGRGAAHNVAASDGRFVSPYHTTAGATFDVTFDTAGVVTYLCVPHEHAGMRGVIVVE